MKVIVISLGGSVMVLDKINFSFLEKFKKLLEKNSRTTRFVIVTGGGSVARKYIQALKEEGKGEKELSRAGIRVTRLNALFLMQFFGKEANDSLPFDMEHVKSNLHKNKVVICGALRYDDKETSDGTAAKLANYLKCDFVNITNATIANNFIQNYQAKNICILKFINNYCREKFTVRILNMLEIIKYTKKFRGCQYKVVGRYPFKA